MQTSISETLAQTPDGQEADAILRRCVHCGFCNATCPTYRLLGDERDGPRGRIYLLKQLLEGQDVGARTRLHLDRCLTCRACETTCPSGVSYHRLADIGRGLLATRAPPPWPGRLLRSGLRQMVTRASRVTRLVRLAQMVRPALPRRMRALVPPRRELPAWPSARRARSVVLLHGCVQPALAPEIDLACARVLDSDDISTLRPAGAGCCGALSWHLGAHDEARAFMRANIDAWWPALEAGAEAVVASSSGCAAMLKDYGAALREEPAYAAKAARVAALAADPSQVPGVLERTPAGLAGRGRRIAFHVPCTLQHALRVDGQVANLLTGRGHVLTEVPDALACCGSAGTYSLLQPKLAHELRARKLDALLAGRPDEIVTANIGCLIHLRAASPVPVRHWLELLAEDLG